jgi:hypothetical protein
VDWVSPHLRSDSAALRAGFAVRFPGFPGGFGWVGLLWWGYHAAYPARISVSRATRDFREGRASAGPVVLRGHVYRTGVGAQSPDPRRNHIVTKNYCTYAPDTHDSYCT